MAVDASNQGRANVEIVHARTEKQLAACAAASDAVGAAVGALSQAGSGLQRALSALQAEGGSLHGADTKALPGLPVLLGACGAAGEGLVSLAAALSSDVQRPLVELHRAVAADLAGRSAELERLRQEHASCASALTECSRRKEKSAAELQAAATAQKATEAAASAGERRSFRPQWLGGSGSAKAKERSESKLLKAMELNAASVDEYAERHEEVVAVSDSAQREAEAFVEVFDYVDESIRTTFLESLLRCSSAWTLAAQQLERQSQQLRRCSEEEPGGEARLALERSRPPPAWARTAIGAVRPCKDPEQQIAADPGQRDDPDTQVPTCESVAVVNVGNADGAEIDSTPSSPHQESTTSCSVSRAAAEAEAEEQSTGGAVDQAVVASAEGACASAEARIEEAACAEEGDKADEPHAASAEEERRADVPETCASQPGAAAALVAPESDENEVLSNPEGKACDTGSDGQAARSISEASTDVTRERAEISLPRDTELYQKLEPRRILAEQHNGEDLTTTPAGYFAKASTTSFHPDMAEKLERRRKVIDEACGESW